MRQLVRRSLPKQEGQAASICRLSGALLGLHSGAFYLPRTAIHASAACCRWLAARASTVEELSLGLRMQQLSANQLVLAVVVPQPQGLPALRQLTIEWPGTAMWTTAARPWQELLPALTKLEFVQGTQLCLENRGLCVLHKLREFGLADGTLDLAACPPASPWLPPTVTSLCLANASVRGIPATVTCLTSLRRQVPLYWLTAVSPVGPVWHAGGRAYHQCVLSPLPMHHRTSPLVRCSLVVSQNRFSSMNSLALLPPLASSLEELNLSETCLRAFPSQVSRGRSSSKGGRSLAEGRHVRPGCSAAPRCPACPWSLVFTQPPQCKIEHAHCCRCPP